MHYVTFGSGMQTWEYSPAFALRSYALVELYALPVRLAQLLGLPKALILKVFRLMRSWKYMGLYWILIL